MQRRRWIAPLLLIGIVVGTGTALASWKHSSLEQAESAAQSQPEPAEAVAVAIAREREHSPTTTAIGTVVATRSISVRNELPGTVRTVDLMPGRIVEPGTVLVALDVSVETAELQALQAQADLAQTQYERMQRMVHDRAASEMEVDQARAERDVALAQIERLKAVIDRKTIRAPFRARIGLSDVHPGQYLNEGTLLTTLQGVDEYAYADFTVAQQVAAKLQAGERIQVFSRTDDEPMEAEILAVDARVDPTTRNAAVRARLPADNAALRPGASVRVRVSTDLPRLAVAVPASAVRKSPEGDHVFVLVSDESGNVRAKARQVRVETVAGDEAIIERGLSPGEKVAATGSFKLRDSALVAVIDASQSVAALSAAR
jgi:membrane fusion protein (multidrug efflux system)